MAHILTLSSKFGDVRFNQEADGRITCMKIDFIKVMRDATNCTLKDAMQLVDRFMVDVNKMTPDIERVRAKAIVAVNAINNADDLQAVLRFASTMRA